jgi:mono/diheme cytochrome c family protein
VKNFWNSHQTFGRILVACTIATMGFAAWSVTTVHGQDKPTTPAVAQTAPPTESNEDNTQFFTQKVRPVLAQNCYKCHMTEASGGLRLDSHEAVMKGGDSGPAIVPGVPEKSILIDAVMQAGDLKMPPKGGKLTDGDIANLVEWVKRGGTWDSAEATMPAVTLTSAEAKGAPGADYFENKVRPILVNSCGSCHQERSSGGLSLTSRAALLKGGDSGPAVAPGDPEKSLMLVAVHQTGVLKMPKGGKLSPEDVAVLTEWIRIGAPWPQTTAPMVATGKQITDDMRRFWSFMPLVDSPVPPVKDPSLKGWAKTDIDHFVLAKLDEKGMKPAPMADKRTLIRRATLDLIGLPPTPEEIEAFEKNNSADAFAKVVDRLLASPQYGVRWGRHWLDVARYGDGWRLGVSRLGDQAGQRRFAVRPICKAAAGGGSDVSASDSGRFEGHRFFGRSSVDLGSGGTDSRARGRAERTH